MKRRPQKRSVLIKKLDQAFSRYIRLRDSDQGGMVRCCTCSSVKHWKEMQAGHFVSRRHFATRWDEQNVHGQCAKCNIFDQGAGPMYSLFLIERYGPKILDELVVRSAARKKFSVPDLEEMLDYYEAKVSQMMR